MSGSIQIHRPLYFYDISMSIDSDLCRGALHVCNDVFGWFFPCVLFLSVCLRCWFTGFFICWRCILSECEVQWQIPLQLSHNLMSLLSIFLSQYARTRNKTATFDLRRLARKRNNGMLQRHITTCVCNYVLAVEHVTLLVWVRKPVKLIQREIQA